MSPIILPRPGGRAVRLACLLAVAVAPGVAHAGPASGTPDAPLDWVESASAVVDGVWAREVRGGGFDAGGPVEPREIHLVPADDGLAETLADLDLAPGTYDRVRVLVESGEVVLSDDAVVQDDHVFTTDAGDLRFPSGGQTGIKLAVDPPIRVVTRLSQDLELDPDLGRSFVLDGSPTGPTGVKDVTFTPVVPTANKSTHGRITLRVLHATTKCAADEALPGATVTAIDRSGSTPDVTTSSDPQGEAWISLLPGTYDIRVEADGYDPVTVADQEVYLANETAIGDVTLVRRPGFDQDTALLLSLMSIMAYGDGQRPCLKDVSKLAPGDPLKAPFCDLNDPPVRTRFADYIEPCWRFLRYIDVAVDSTKGGAQLFLARNENDDDIVVAFAGTADSADVVADAAAVKASWSLSGPPVDEAVHLGFREEYLAVRALLTAELDSAIRAYVRDPSRSRVFFTGHSLGGALAGIAALDLSDHLVGQYGYARDDIVMYSFGAPRWLTTNLVGEFADRVPSGFAVAAKDDIVPHLPPRGRSPEYTHIVNLRVLSSNIENREPTADGDRYRKIGATRVEISDGLPYTGCQGVVRAVGDPKVLNVGIPVNAYGKYGHDQWQYLKRIENIVEGDGIPSVALRAAPGPLGVDRVQLVWTGGVQGPCDWVALYDSGALPPANSGDYVRFVNGREWAVFGEGYPLGESTHLTRKRIVEGTDWRNGLWIGYVDGFGRVIRASKSRLVAREAGQGRDATGSDLFLGSASPNPAVRGIALRFAVPQACEVRFTVHDVAGRLVRELDDGSRDAGEYTERWDLRDGRGRAVSAGIYFVRLEAVGHTLVRKVTVTR